MHTAHRIHRRLKNGYEQKLRGKGPCPSLPWKASTNPTAPVAPSSGPWEEQPMVSRCLSNSSRMALTGTSDWLCLGHVTHSCCFSSLLTLRLYYWEAERPLPFYLGCLPPPKQKNQKSFKRIGSQNDKRSFLWGLQLDASQVPS